MAVDAGPLQHRFYTTANSHSFAQIGAEWLEKEIHVEHVTLWQTKIYEYKDDQDWYVGSYSVFGGIRTLTDDDLEFPLFDLAKIFRDEERGLPLSVTVLRYGSAYRLLSFVVDILNQEANRNLRSYSTPRYPCS